MDLTPSVSSPPQGIDNRRDAALDLVRAVALDGVLLWHASTAGG